MKAPPLTKPNRTVLESAAAELRRVFKPLSAKFAAAEEMERRLDAAREEHAKLSANEDLDDATITQRLSQAERAIGILPQKITKEYAELAALLDECHNAAHACLAPFDELVYEPLRQRKIAEIAKPLLPFSFSEESARALAERADALQDLLKWRRQMAGGVTAQQEVPSIKRLLAALAAALAGEEVYDFAATPAK